MSSISGAVWFAMKLDDGDKAMLTATQIEVWGKLGPALALCFNGRSGCTKTRNNADAFIGATFLAAVLL